jgi:hypothetical protein
VGICGIHCRRLLGTSWLGDSNIDGTYFVEPCSIDLSDRACWIPFSLRGQVVLGTSYERARVCANRPDGGRSTAIAISVANARAIVVAKSPSLTMSAVSSTFSRTLLYALIEERHFALIGGLRFPIRARF